MNEFEKLLSFQKDLDEMELRHRNEAHPLRLNVEDQEMIVRRDIAMSFELEDVEIGSWFCPKSPIKVCVYDSEDGPQDFCLYCGEPDERK